MKTVRPTSAFMLLALMSRAAPEAGARPTSAATAAPLRAQFSWTISISIHIGDAPSRAQTKHFVHFVNEQRARNKPVAVHCQGGQGRTGTLMAAYLIAEGEDAATAMVRVRAVEPNAIETARQVEFLERFARFCQRWL